ncbi:MULTISPECIES: N-acetylglucosamine kinase [unclassified Microbacterium]|uniref:N-acetylglucosamine kinase n=1 Tax=unclassified Microbacterium TaxID=2609290 RepID=UPI000EA84379|nr:MULTISPECIES: BadF/BadG/BcrA/BcrD ATPase family protein [unclassified Microbacterium]MBT2485116.1 ATPase [Microbacterium sp. ISL-108]RKN69557.1 ATPase [Microbacterium sp. CGR2]
MTPHPDAAVIAVDGGNSKTDVAVVRIDGEVLSVARSGGHRPHAIGIDAAERELHGAVIEALATAGEPDVVAIGAYVANADFAIEEQVLRDRILSWGITEGVEVGNDTLALLRSGVDDRVGVAVVCGAGINCVGLGRNGEVARFPAIGTITGDWGGGFDLSLAAMFHAARSEDGRGPATMLSPMIARHFARATTLDVSEGMHLGDIDQKRLHEIVPVLFDAAQRGDEIAGDVVARQAHEVVSMATIALDRVGLADVEADVVLGGGVLAADYPLLSQAVRRGIAATHPLAHVTIPELSPLMGSILLALDELPLDPAARSAAEERARASLVRVKSGVPRSERHVAATVQH